MDTISKRLKDAVRASMQEDRVYSNENFRQLIYERTGMKYKVDYLETHFAGCLSALKKSGEIVQIQRGEYKKGNMKRQSGNACGIEKEMLNAAGKAPDGMMPVSQVKEEVLQSVRRELTFLRSRTKNIMMSFDTPEEDIQYMLKLKELVKSLEQFEQQAGV